MSASPLMKAPSSTGVLRLVNNFFVWEANTAASFPVDDTCYDKCLDVGMNRFELSSQTMR